MQTTIQDQIHTPEWAALVREDADSSFFHTSAWLDALRAGYPDYRARLLLVRAPTGRVMGGMPVIQSRRFGLTQWLSLPYGTYGTPLVAGGSLDPAQNVRATLLSRWRSEVGRPGVARGSLVLFRASGWSPRINGLPGSWRRVERTHIVSLARGFQAHWQDAYSGDKRTGARRAVRLGVRVKSVPGARGMAILERLYRRQSTSWRDHTPYRPGLFEYLGHLGEDQVMVWVAFQGDEPVEAALALYHRTSATVWITSGSEQARTCRASQILYTTMLRDASERGCDDFNLGASKGLQGLEMFKASLGGVPTEYETWLYNAGWFRPIHRLYYRLRGIRERTPSPPG